MQSNYYTPPPILGGKSPSATPLMPNTPPKKKKSSIVVVVAVFLFMLVWALPAVMYYFVTTVSLSDIGKEEENRASTQEQDAFLAGNFDPLEISNIHIVAPDFNNPALDKSTLTFRYHLLMDAMAERAVVQSFDQENMLYVVRRDEAGPYNLDEIFDFMRQDADLPSWVSQVSLPFTPIALRIGLIGEYQKTPAMYYVALSKDGDVAVISDEEIEAQSRLNPGVVIPARVLPMAESVVRVQTFVHAEVSSRVATLLIRNDGKYYDLEELYTYAMSPVAPKATGILAGYRQLDRSVAGSLTTTSSAEDYYPFVSDGDSFVQMQSYAATSLDGYPYTRGRHTAVFSDGRYRRRSLELPTAIADVQLVGLGEDEIVEGVVKPICITESGHICYYDERVPEGATGTIRVPMVMDEGRYLRLQRVLRGSSRDSLRLGLLAVRVNGGFVDLSATNLSFSGTNWTYPAH